MNKNEWTYVSTWSKKIKAINLLGGKCYQCGENRPWILDFHHNDPNQKEFTINNIKYLRWSIIEKEIQKCILLCTNCHIEKTKLINDQDNKRSQNKIIILDYLKKDYCETCNYNKCNQALHFHHYINLKNFAISQYNKRMYSVYDIDIILQKELNKCILICSNCHRDLHFDKEKFNKYKEQIYNYNVKEIQKSLDKEKIIIMFNSGMKQIDIAKEFNCAKSTICGIIKKYKQDVG